MTDAAHVPMGCWLRTAISSEEGSPSWPEGEPESEVPPDVSDPGGGTHEVISLNFSANFHQEFISKL